MLNRPVLFAVLLCAQIASAQTTPSTIIPTGHTRGITSLDISPDGKYLLSSGLDRIAILWEIATGTPIYDFQSSKTNGSIALFSPNGKYILTGGSSAAGIGVIATLWDVQTKKMVREIRSEKAYADFIDFSKDGSQFATTGINGLVQIWDTETGKLKNEFNTSLGKGSIHFSTDDKRIILPRRGLDIFNAATGDKIATIEDEEITTYTYSIPSPDGRHALYAGGEMVTVFDLQSGEFVRQLTARESVITSLDYSPDGQFALVGCDDGTATYWNVKSGKLLRSFSPGIKPGTAMEEISKNFSGTSGQVKAVKLSPDGKQVFIGTGDRRILLFDVATGKLEKTFLGPNMVIEYVYVSTDLKHLYVRELGTKKIKHLNILTGEVDQVIITEEPVFEKAIELPTASKYQLAPINNHGVLFYDPTTKKYIGALYFLGEKDWYFNYRFGEGFDASKNGIDYIFTIDGFTTAPVKQAGNPKYKPGVLKTMFK